MFILFQIIFLIFCLITCVKLSQVKILTTNTSSEIQIILPSCQSNIDCDLNGYCDLIQKKCVCIQGFETLLNKTLLTQLLNNTNSTYSNVTVNTTFIYNYDFTICNYKLKDQMTALMLSIFVGFGIEHFYMERYKVGAAKLVFYLLCCVLNLFYFIIFKCVKDGRKYLEFIGAFETFYLICGFVFMMLWNIYDWVNIGYNSFLDGNGMKLKSWNSTDN